MPWGQQHTDLEAMCGLIRRYPEGVEHCEGSPQRPASVLAQRQASDASYLRSFAVLTAAAVSRLRMTGWPCSEARDALNSHAKVRRR